MLSGFGVPALEGGRRVGEIKSAQSAQVRTAAKKAPLRGGQERSAAAGTHSLLEGGAAGGAFREERPDPGGPGSDTARAATGHRTADRASQSGATGDSVGDSPGEERRRAARSGQQHKPGLAEHERTGRTANRHPRTREERRSEQEEHPQKRSWPKPQEPTSAAAGRAQGCYARL